MHGPMDVKFIAGYFLTLVIHIFLCVLVVYLKMLLVTRTVYNRMS